MRHDMIQHIRAIRSIGATGGRDQGEDHCRKTVGRAVSRVPAGQQTRFRGTAGLPQGRFGGKPFVCLFVCCVAAALPYHILCSLLFI